MMMMKGRHSRVLGLGRRMMSSSRNKVVAPPMVYISGEEMTHYTMNLILDRWVKPFCDIGKWEFYDLSCVSRDNTEDKVLHDAVEAGARLGAIFKEPTVTPTEVQKEKLGLKKSWGSPNGAMRRGWNGITISRDTIHIDGMELGFKRPVLFERHAVGGEYSAGFDIVGQGKLTTTFEPENGEPRVVDSRELSDENNAVVTYHNPLDNVTDLAHHFFNRCLDGNVTPYVVTKKTVFKWQEPFWTTMKDVFDNCGYKEKFLKKNLLDDTNGELCHLISDAATMQIIRWTGGGFGMAAHNYDGDMLTDEISQVHRSPGFITSNLIGKSESGSLIKEFEASHGTVADMWEAHQRGEETSLNPLGMVEALIGAIQHSAHLDGKSADNEAIVSWTNKMRKCIHKAMVEGRGTRDLCGPEGLSTEQFVDEIASMMDEEVTPEVAGLRREKSFVPVTSDDDFDETLARVMFDDLDTDGNGTIDFEEFSNALIRLNIQPRAHGFTHSD